jgi:hypothetical protein
LLAERMFPAPADPGIARPDRAVASVRSGTDTTTSGDYKNELQRFQERFGRVSRNVVVALSYDTARAAMGGIGNARIATPEGQAGP